MLYLRYPCPLIRVPITYFQKVEKITRIYSSHKILPKQPVEKSAFSVSTNQLADTKIPLYVPDSDKTLCLPIKVLDLSGIQEIINQKEKWREIKLETEKLGRYILKLSKFRLTTLVVITSAIGYALPPTEFNLVTFLCCVIGTGMLSSSANSINQFLEVPFDAQMSRTRNRVLVQGYLMPVHAVGFATCMASLGLLTLYYGTNPLTAGLGAGNLVLYTSIYTPLKRISILNTWVGSVVGAIPPMMGWAACQGSLDYGALIIGGILYAWQFPHFNALSWNLRPDYSRAGYRMMAVTHPALCRRTALRYTIGITGLCTLAPLVDLTHWSFGLISLPVNLYFTFLAFKFYQKSDSQSSRKLFRFSLLHLPLLLTLMLAFKKHWGFISSSNETEASHTINKGASLSSYDIVITGTR